MKAAFLLLVTLLIAPGLHAQADWESYHFHKADSIAALYPRHSLKNLKQLADKLTLQLPTDEEKFRAIYRWVCYNIEYDYPLYRANSRQRATAMTPQQSAAWNNKFSALVFDHLLQSRRTICTGYAYLVRELAQYAGLHCVIIDGYGRTAQSNIEEKGVPNHSWNAVQLNSKWYLCDPTWSAGAFDVHTLRYIKKYNDAYFLAEPRSFVRNHYPLDSAWILLKEKPTLQTFLNGPIIYSGAVSGKITNLFPDTFNVSAAKGEIVNFRLTTAGNIPSNDVTVRVQGPNVDGFAQPEIYTGTDGSVCIEKAFNTRGKHVVHILDGDQYILTYQVTVR